MLSRVLHHFVNHSFKRKIEFASLMWCAISHYFFTITSFTVYSSILGPPTSYVSWVWLLSITKDPKCCTLKKKIAPLYKSTNTSEVFGTNPPTRLAGFAHMLIWSITAMDGKNVCFLSKHQVTFKKKENSELPTGALFYEVATDQPGT